MVLLSYLALKLNTFQLIKTNKNLRVEKQSMPSYGYNQESYREI